MIRNLYNDLTPEELNYAKPDPARLVSFGEQTRFAEVLTNSGRKMVPVVFEVFYEREGAIGFGNRSWHRYRDRPNELIPQFSLNKTDTVHQEEPYTDDELAAMRAALPAKDPPVPDPPPQPLTVKPSW